MDDVLIVGGGVIGLSLAYELAGRGLQVRVLERGVPGKEASWAGAGILPPASRQGATDPLRTLVALSNELHAPLAAELRELTGIDTGYRRCGGLQLASSESDATQLQTLIDSLSQEGVAVEKLDAAALQQREPALAGEQLQAAYYLPEEAQLRNPRHLKALLAACSLRGVAIETGCEVHDFTQCAGRIESVATALGDYSAGTVCITGGAWSGVLLRRLGLQLSVRPVRGQMVLLSGHRPLFRSVLNEGPRYLVPRSDGRVLVGSTQEDAGFDKRTTAGGIGGLLELATRLVPALQDLRVEQTWAGLRPWATRSQPYMGQLPELENAYVAAGHFRAGLQMSPAVATVMSDLIQGQTPAVDLATFAVHQPVPR